MKKLLVTLALAICCAMATTSCDQLNNNSDEWVYYSVNPSGEFSGTSAMTVAQLMRAGLQAELTNDVGLARRNDSKAIQICDRIYNETKPGASGKFKIALDVQDSNGKSSNLKTYSYN